MKQFDFREHLSTRPVGRRRSLQASLLLPVVLMLGALAGLSYPTESAQTEPIPIPLSHSTPVIPPKTPTPDPWAASRLSQRLLASQQRAALEPALAAVGPRGSAALTRVVDGDTFWYGGEKIRIADIDTPEMAGRCEYESQLARQAAQRLQTLLAEGSFELQSIGGRDIDRYGRKLRVVTRGGRSLGDVLVSEGLARTWTGRREPWCPA